MTQLWKFFKNSVKHLKIYNKTATENNDFEKMHKREKKTSDSHNEVSCTNALVKSGCWCGSTI